MSGARLCALLEELGFDGQDSSLDPDSFEWPFQYEEARPLLDWICSSLRPSNVLSVSELSQYGSSFIFLDFFDVFLFFVRDILSYIAWISLNTSVVCESLNRNPIISLNFPIRILKCRTVQFPPNASMFSSRSPNFWALSVCALLLVLFLFFILQFVEN